MIRMFQTPGTKFRNEKNGRIMLDYFGDELDYDNSLLIIR